MQHPTEELPLGERLNHSVNSVLLIADALAFPSIVVLHRNIGRRFCGMQTLLSILLLFFWPILDQRADPRPMLWSIAATISMCAWSRLQGLRRMTMAGGDSVHRQYDGTPRLMRFVCCQNTLLVKRLHEPLLVLVIGFVAKQEVPLLGSFLMASAAGLFITANASAFAYRERVESMRDRVLEQRWLATRFRSGSGK